MKMRVLALRTNSYPDVATATRRFESFCHYLHEDGFDVTVLALAPRHPAMVHKRYLSPSCRFKVIHVPIPPQLHPVMGWLENQCARKIFPGMAESRAANRAVARAAARLLGQQRFDAMVTTYPPLGSLVLADRLSRKNSLPWIADLRDIPDEIDVQRRQWITRRAVRILTRACASASHILTVSEPLGLRLKTHYGIQAPISIVYNGFDEEQLEKQEIPATGASFRVTYCGNMGFGRDPLLLFEALDILTSRGVNLQGLEIHFYGTLDKETDLPQRWQSLIRCHGVVPHVEALAAEIQSAILLSLSSPASAQGILTSKIFEYAMLRRPVLSIPPDNDVLDQFIRQAKIGHVGVSAEDVAAFIKSHLESWRATGALPKTHPDEQFLQQFSRRAQAAKVAEVLRGIQCLRK